MSIVPNNIGYGGYYFVFLSFGALFKTKSQLCAYVNSNDNNNNFDNDQ